MRINYIKLKNIRSYDEEVINFNTGSTLLYGDIGCGKTTILLAMEFAIFGISRGDLSGNLLLRHGEMQGYVEINFELEKQNITIKRELKRNKDSISQSRCAIIIDDETQILTPTELKEKLFSLFGYQKDLVSKNSSLIYKYTVYTPQEQLKQILYDDPKNRIELLRKIFNIEKYKKIINNIEIYSKSIRDRIKVDTGKIDDIPKIKQEISRLNNNITFTNKAKEDLLVEITKQKDNLSSQKKSIEELNKQIEKLNEIKNKNTLLNQKIQSLSKQKKEIELDDENNNEKLKNLKSNVKDINIEEKDTNSITEEINILEKEYNEKIIEQNNILNSKKNKIHSLQKHSEEILEIQTSLEKEFKIPQELENKQKTDTKEYVENKNKIIQDIDKNKETLFRIKTLISESKKIKDNVSELDNCPFCLQKVNNEHKDRIVNDELEKQNNLSKKANNKEDELDKLNKDLELIQQSIKSIEDLNMKISKYEQTNKLKSIQLSKLDKLIESQEILKKELEELESKIKEFQSTDTIKNKLQIKKEELAKAIQSNKLILEQKNINEQINMVLKIITFNTQKIMEIEKEISNLNPILIENNKNLNENMHLYTNLEESKVNLDSLLNEIKQSEIKISNFDRDIINLGNNKKMFETNLDEKNRIKEKILKMKEINNWLNKSFINIMTLMETKKLQNIQIIFNELFQRWFKTLLEDEQITVRVDENFNPIIEQNGYDTTIQNLSGGEKTSLALSYRLALTKVINSVINSIKTNELIILDEPTDGFSSQQLDKMRDVLDEINIKQTIIVSHESKIESFVDNQIYISKKEHISHILWKKYKFISNSR